ncbi:MAG: hypothetical protein AAF762_00195 [Pseudomonadota bacterium]
MSDLEQRVRRLEIELTEARTEARHGRAEAAKVKKEVEKLASMRAMFNGVFIAAGVVGGLVAWLFGDNAREWVVRGLQGRNGG